MFDPPPPHDLLPPRQYSSSWQHHNSFSYRYVHKTPFGAYSFLALDACPSPGPKRPFNFFGIIHEEDVVGLRSIAVASVGDNQTLWFSHYPSATIMGDHHWLRELMSHAIGHVCGHLHTLGELFPRMYGRHPSGHLELELGDFKVMRRWVGEGPGGESRKANMQGSIPSENRDIPLETFH